MWCGVGLWMTQDFSQVSLRGWVRLNSSHWQGTAMGPDGVSAIALMCLAKAFLRNLVSSGLLMCLVVCCCRPR